ncbi:MAG: hypothetical protein JNG85_16005, partial [Spirochaetaceae bacterium]|nr:hypothetical protein [Spirochaetaceae bacterium]
MKAPSARRAAGLFAAIAIGSLGLAACSSKAYDAEAAEIVGFADEASGYRLSLSRDGAKVVGAWEDRKGARFGLLDGEAGPDGGLKLRLSSNNTNRESDGFEGRLSADGTRLEGRLVPAGGGAPLELGLARLPAFAAGLKPARVRSEERGSLPAASEPARFDYFSIEIAKPKALRDWYRAEMQGGRDAVAAIERER